MGGACWNAARRRQMSKARLIMAAACAALALIWAGCDGDPTRKERAVKMAATRLAEAAPK